MQACVRVRLVRARVLESCRWCVRQGGNAATVALDQLRVRATSARLEHGWTAPNLQLAFWLSITPAILLIWVSGSMLHGFVHSSVGS